jgi:hypothetical protein
MGRRGGHPSHRELENHMLLFLVINPENCSDFSIHQSIEEATALLESQGFTLSCKREIKSSPRMRCSYYKNGESRYVYCRNMGEVCDQ